MQRLCRPRANSSRSVGCIGAPENAGREGQRHIAKRYGRSFANCLYELRKPFTAEFTRLPKRPGSLMLPDLARNVR